MYTVFITALTLAIHGASASSVKQTNQVNQGSSYLSKREKTTCAFDNGIQHISFEKKERLYTTLAKLFGSDAGCKVTNSLLELSTLSEFSGLSGKDSHIDKRSLSDSMSGSTIIHHHHHNHPGGNNDIYPDYSPKRMPTGEPSDRILPKEKQELQDIITLLVGEKLGPSLTRIVMKVSEPKFLIKFFKILGKKKIVRKLLGSGALIRVFGGAYGTLGAVGPGNADSDLDGGDSNGLGDTDGAGGRPDAGLGR
jgi:hypothetical protein